MPGTHKWTAFWLSLLLPGAGQLAARSWSAGLWVLAGAGLAIASATLFSGNGWPTGLLKMIPLSLFALASAEHAKRLLEQPSHSVRTKPTCRRRWVTSQGNRGRTIDVLMTLQFARSRDEFWPIVADLPIFLTIDPFHDRVTLQRLPAGKGVDLVLHHNAFGLRFFRFGRITAWREGSGYTFSDLSGRKPEFGFPHVFIIELLRDETDDGVGCKLTIRVRGRWTSRLIPVFVGRLWVSWVCREHARLLAAAL